MEQKAQPLQCRGRPLYNDRDRAGPLLRHFALNKHWVNHDLFRVNLALTGNRIVMSCDEPGKCQNENTQRIPGTQEHGSRILKNKNLHMKTKISEQAKYRRGRVKPEAERSKIEAETRYIESQTSKKLTIQLNTNETTMPMKQKPRKATGLQFDQLTN